MQYSQRWDYQKEKFATLTDWFCQRNANISGIDEKISTINLEEIIIKWKLTIEKFFWGS